MSKPTGLENMEKCPKCGGFIVNDEHYDAPEEIWISYIKCVNCGWRAEVGLMTSEIKKMAESHLPRRKRYAHIV